MGKAILAIAVLTFGLQGCAGAAIYGESRKVSREVLLPVVAQELPGKDTEAATTCILKGMTVGEVLSLPNSEEKKQAAALRGLVREVSARPGVDACLATAPGIAG